MYLTMNRFKVTRGREAAFEEMWANRESHLDGVKGFKSFHLLKGAEAADHTVYISHSEWADRASFEAWTKSEAFRRAHAGVKPQTDLYLGPPELELFESVQSVS